MGEDGGGVRREQASDHQSDEARRKELQHGGEGAVVPDQLRVGAGNAAWMSFSSGKMMIEQSAVRIHGHGRST